MSDLIDRQELYHEMTVKSMELFEKGLVWHEFRRGFDFAMEFVQEAPSTEPEQKWIPVTERLPKNHEDVLVYGIEAINNKYLYAVKCWDVDTWRPLSAPSVSWIAWQPLPEPWEGE